MEFRLFLIRDYQPDNHKEFHPAVLPEAIRLMHLDPRNLSEGKTYPTVIVRSSWGQNGSISIGNKEKLNRINQYTCAQLGIPYLRRFTPAYAIYQDSRYDVSIEWIFPKELFQSVNLRIGSKEVEAPLRYLMQPALAAIKKLRGEEAIFEPAYDFVFDKKKIAATTLDSTGGVVLMQSNILVQDFDYERNCQIFHLEDGESEKLKRMGSLQVDRELFLETLKTELERFPLIAKYGLRSDLGLTEYELSKISELSYAAENDFALKNGHEDGKICYVHWGTGKRSQQNNT